MVRALGVLTMVLVLVIAIAVSNTVVGPPPGAQVADSESALVMGGTCYRIGTSLISKMCYNTDCSSGGCGCTTDAIIITPNGTHLLSATPCAASWKCTTRHTTDTTACGVGG